MTAIVAFVTSILSAIPGIERLLDRFFPKKTEAEKERARLADVIRARRKTIKELNEAIGKARDGDTSGLNDILDRD